MPADLTGALRHRDTCRVCETPAPELILSLGPTPLANAFLSSPGEFADEPSFPLDLYFCHECSLLQLVDVVDPSILFRHYLYVTGTSSTMAAHNEAYARTVHDIITPGASDLVVDIASNDGSLLRCFQRLGVRTLGIEPATNLADMARAAGVDTVNEFFTRDLAVRLRADRGPATAVLANNVLAHVDDPAGFLGGCRELVSEDGLVTIEVPDVGELVDRLEYDTVYHEHLSYFSIGALLHLCDRVGLAVVRIDRVPIHGGSLRLYLSRGRHGHAPDVLELRDAERRAGLTAAPRYRQFAEAVRAHRTALLSLIDELSAAGHRLAGYGAPAKGNTLLNFCGIGPDRLPYTVDRNPLKIGRFTPGMHIPVRDPAVLAEDPPPEFVLILAWNLADEIMRQQQVVRDRGGRFIVPIPMPRVV